MARQRHEARQNGGQQTWKNPLRDSQAQNNHIQTGHTLDRGALARLALLAGLLLLFVSLIALLLYRLLS
ncbi:hypothetical protein [Streptomyces gobiensis]|uniref:hypothetical protein n=1 Tax=Streptomyces gobiensis TaxID=2875706 RepID=UPI001E5ACC08|nr:hypothetical protein [Streptomyces gobiensis]UGY90757.1 hypothetical protein test1122_02795 [Streptomyces gobiensis]